MKLSNSTKGHAKKKSTRKSILLSCEQGALKSAVSKSWTRGPMEAKWNKRSILLTEFVYNVLQIREEPWGGRGGGQQTKYCVTEYIDVISAEPVPCFISLPV